MNKDNGRYGFEQKTPVTIETVDFHAEAKAFLSHSILLILHSTRQSTSY